MKMKCINNLNMSRKLIRAFAFLKKERVWHIVRLRKSYRISQNFISHKKNVAINDFRQNNIACMWTFFTFFHNLSFLFSSVLVSWLNFVPWDNGPLCVLERFFANDVIKKWRPKKLDIFQFFYWQLFRFFFLKVNPLSPFEILHATKNVTWDSCKIVFFFLC